METEIVTTNSATQLATMLKIAQMILDGRTILSACKDVGIDRSTYWRWIQANPKAVQEIQDLIVSVEKSQLMNVVSGRQALITQIIDTATSDSVGLMEKLMAEQRLSTIQKDLEARAGVNGINDDSAADFLTGIVLRKQNISVNVNITNDLPDILDVTPN